MNSKYIFIYWDEFPNEIEQNNDNKYTSNTENLFQDVSGTDKANSPPQQIEAKGTGCAI